MAEEEQKSTAVQRDNLDQFLTRKKSEVVSSLLELSRKREPLTVLFDSGQNSFPTSVIDVISDNTRVVIERAGKESINDKLLSQQKATVIGQPGGIKVRFLLEQISAADYQGERVFVAPLPKEHYRMQRRQMFRIDTQIRSPVKVTITPPDAEEITLTAGNISSGGIRLDDVDNVIECETRQVLEGCSIQIPDVEPFLADLQVHNSYEKVKRNGKSVHYVGCEFMNLRANDEREIQNYINRLQLAQMALTK